LPFLLALFLIISAIIEVNSDKFGFFRVRAWYFLPAGLIYAFLSGLMGSTGSLLNPLYLNYGLVKEEMIATKSANLVVIHLAKTVTYAAFGSFTLPYFGYGLLLGIAALPGNWLGQIVLKKLSQQQFRRFAVGFVAVSGILMLGNEIAGRF
jgi:uncharacterized membrane protein YfcA